MTELRRRGVRRCHVFQIRPAGLLWLSVFILQAGCDDEKTPRRPIEDVLADREEQAARERQQLMERWHRDRVTLDIRSREAEADARAALQLFAVTSVALLVAVLLLVNEHRRRCRAERALRKPEARERGPPS